MQQVLTYLLVILSFCSAFPVTFLCSNFRDLVNHWFYVWSLKFRVKFLSIVVVKLMSVQITLWKKRFHSFEFAAFSHSCCHEGFTTYQHLSQCVWVVHNECWCNHWEFRCWKMPNFHLLCLLISFWLTSTKEATNRFLKANEMCLLVFLFTFNIPDSISSLKI